MRCRGQAPEVLGLPLRNRDLGSLEHFHRIVSNASATLDEPCGDRAHRQHGENRHDDVRRIGHHLCRRGPSGGFNSRSCLVHFVPSGIARIAYFIETSGLCSSAHPRAAKRCEPSAQSAVVDRDRTSILNRGFASNDECHRERQHPPAHTATEPRRSSEARRRMPFAIE